MFEDERIALTFDDVLLVPAYSDVLPGSVDISTFLTKNIQLKVPLISAAMDTITDASMAISIAHEGGIGIIHKNMSIEEQANSVRKVKRSESWIINSPITANIRDSVLDILKLRSEHKIYSFPVIDDNGYVFGIITSRDIKFLDDHSALVSTYMTPRERLVVLYEDQDLSEASKLMHKNRLEQVLLVTKEFKLAGLITAKDYFRIYNYPLANKDAMGQLRVGAAVGSKAEDRERIDVLIKSGVDILTIDTAHAHSKNVIEQLKWIKSRYTNSNVIVGNIVTAEAAKILASHGADAVKVGIGPGSICTTRIIAGVGVPQITAINNIYKELKNTDTKIIADGGIRYSGDIAKAIAAGAHSVMLGNLFAGCDETPGEKIIYKGKNYKQYMGMGSITSMKKGSADRYSQNKNTIESKLVPEGIEGRVVYKGALSSVIYQLIGGLKSSMGYLGVRNIAEMRTNSKFIRITSAGMNESHVHNIKITRETSNYTSEPY